MATRGRVWSDQEVVALLAVWSEDSIQRQLLGAVRNTIPYKAIAEELSRLGFSRDYKQCREKVKALKKKYKEVVDAHRRSGTGVSSDDDSFEDVPGFRWFSEIHSVMRTRAVVSPPALLDTSVAGNQPAVTSDEHPRTPSVGEGRSRTPSVSEGRPRTPAVDEDSLGRLQSTRIGLGRLQSTRIGQGRLQSTRSGPGRLQSSLRSGPVLLQLPRR